MYKINKNRRRAKFQLNQKLKRNKKLVRNKLKKD